MKTCSFRHHLQLERCKIRPLLNLQEFATQLWSSQQQAITRYRINRLTAYSSCQSLWKETKFLVLKYLYSNLSFLGIILKSSMTSNPIQKIYCGCAHLSSYCFAFEARRLLNIHILKISALKIIAIHF